MLGLGLPVVVAEPIVATDPPENPLRCVSLVSNPVGCVSGKGLVGLVKSSGW